MQSGGSFDVDYEVTGPNDKVILDGEKERQGDFVFTALEEGEYKFCFNNQMSTFAEKFVDFEISVGFPFLECLQLRAPLPPPGTCGIDLTDHLSPARRSRTKRGPRSPRSRAPRQSRRRRWRSRSSSCPGSCRRSRGTRSTSGRGRTATSARCAAQSGGSSTSASSRA